jgi:DNA-binding CsgD family transcriptional regulator
MVRPAADVVSAGGNCQVHPEIDGRPFSADEVIEQARDLVIEVDEVVGRPGDAVAEFRAIETLDSAMAVALSGERRVRDRLAARTRAGRADDSSALTLLVRLQALRLSIGEVRVRRRAATVSELHRSLARLRSADSVSDLLRDVPRELGSLGFSRSLMSGLQGTRWAARSAFAFADESMAAALVEVGTAMPGRIGREQPETEAVQRRTPVLVRDAQHQPHIHRELITLANTRDYAVAPVIAHGRVVGLVHIDRHDQCDVVDAADRDLLGVFADGVGLAFERARYRERLLALRRQFEAQIDGLDDMFYGSAEQGWALEAHDARADSLVVQPFLDGGPLSALTRRELEVLRHLAGGASNQDLASRLGVSVGTVKTHVKNVLRKLGAENRGEAAARFHAYARDLPPRRSS